MKTTPRGRKSRRPPGTCSTSSKRETFEPANAAPAQPWWRLEDWIVVWVGLAILGLVLGGYRPAGFSTGWSDGRELAAALSEKLPGWLTLALQAGAIATAAIALIGVKVRSFAPAFSAVFALAVGSQILAGNAIAKEWGLEYVIFALLLGLLVSSTIGTPAWLAPAVQTELYIKVGIVLMGATILFSEILEAGILGVLQSVVVVAVVWFFSFWLAKKLRLDDEFATMLSTAVSICGVSAAIAACGAIEGDRRKLSYVTSIVLIVAVPMIVIQPWLVRLLGLPEQVAGAWLGGTLDTTGSVVAAGELIGETATKVGTIVKFSQNVLIGFAAFLLSLWWSSRSTGAAGGVSAAVIWRRFPKFVLGFAAASLIFSFVLHPEVSAAAKPTLTNLRNVWFALAFVSIGLETKFVDLLTMENGRPFWSFVGAQAFNVIFTLLVAWLVFGGVWFEVPSF